MVQNFSLEVSACSKTLTRGLVCLKAPTRGLILVQKLPLEVSLCSNTPTRGLFIMRVSFFFQSCFIQQIHSKVSHDNKTYNRHNNLSTHSTYNNLTFDPFNWWISKEFKNTYASLLTSCNFIICNNKQKLKRATLTIIKNV